MNTIRGIECTITDKSLSCVLMFLANEKYELYVPWCTLIDTPKTLFPCTLKNQHVNSLDLQIIAKQSIWELVLKLYPSEKVEEPIETYEDYEKSECVCYLIYYDCGILDVYVKDQALMERLYKLLSSLDVSLPKFLTQENDSRTQMYP